MKSGLDTSRGYGNLIRKATRRRTDTLKQLKDRYSATLSDLDKEYSELGGVQSMLADLVVVE